MKEFKDTKDRVWEIQIHVHAIARVQSRCKINLWKLAEGKAVLDELSDPVVLVNVLYVLCEEQTQRLNVSDVDFGSAMGGDALDDAATALMEELVDFFPKAKRAILRKCLETGRVIEQKALQAATAALDRPEFADELLKQLIPNVSLGNSQGSSVSTPAD